MEDIKKKIEEQFAIFEREIRALANPNRAEASIHPVDALHFMAKTKIEVMRILEGAKADG